jgi:glutathione-specific gamma-glutamylcyclotransferase
MSLTATASCYSIFVVFILVPFAAVFSFVFRPSRPSADPLLFVQQQRQQRYYSSSSASSASSSSKPSLPSAFNAMSFGQASSTPTAALLDTDEREFDTLDGEDDKEEDTSTPPRPYWDPVAQIYAGGVIPENNEQVREMIASDKEAGGGARALRLFGYGSLCWNPGGGVLADARVTSQPGRCKGYRRCWAQKSTDHRGRPRFPGIVCTLLTRDEVASIRNGYSIDHGAKKEAEEEIWTEGLLYEIPRDLVDKCLAELDFREKGGYARDIITVVEDATGDEHPALLYRGTRDNPALWPRALVDLPYAAAVMSVAQGPSGNNDVYLHQLDAFLKDASSSSNGNSAHSSSVPSLLETLDDTVRLAKMVEQFQEKTQLYFLFGCGSNQHNQLLLDVQCGNGNRNNIIYNNNSPTTIRNYAQLLHGQDDAHEIMEIVLCTDKQQSQQPHYNQDDARAKQVFAGGGHSALLTQGGSLYLFGWNDSGQCGSVPALPVEKEEEENDESCPLPATRALLGLPGGIEACALGFNHTVVVERGTGRVYAFGNNQQGQVDGNRSNSFCKQIETPITPAFLVEDFVIDVACGLFHSAAVTRDGEVVVWGGGKAAHVSRWTPPDSTDVRFIRVACGRMYTVLLDNMGRVWTIGLDNKYGQLGRQQTTAPTNTEAHSKDHDIQQPLLVRGPWEDDNVFVSEISCGWSHTVVLAKKRQVKHGPNDDDSPNTVAYGWGRNDKGQLGTGTTENVLKPIRLFESFQKEERQQQQQERKKRRRRIQLISCGSEFTVVLVEERDSLNHSRQQLWSCGWNEHGNLGIGKDQEPHHHQQQQQQGRQGDNVMDHNRDVLQLTKMVGAPVANPPGYKENAPISVAAGGAHVLVMRTIGV